MRALRFHEFGSPDVLQLQTLPDPQADADYAVVAVKAASINPSDVGNVAGRFPATTLSRTPGRDYSGIVVAGPKEWLDKAVWGTGDAGFTFDGAHAEFIRAPVESLRHKPSCLSHAQAASVGVTFAAAWLGVAEYAAVKPGETLVVIGASGGVGGAAVQIARRRGARVIAIDRTQPEADAPASRLADQIVTPAPQDAAAVVRELTAGRGADVVLNAVGGATFEPSLAMLAHRGRLAVLASPDARRMNIDLLDYYHNESQMFGVDTLKRDMIASAAILDGIAPGFEDGSFLRPIIASIVPLDDAVNAYRSVASGIQGRIALAPDWI